MPQNKRKFVAWRLRLTRGAKEASHNDLEAAENWLENLEIICGAMVFFGVAFEVFIAAKSPPYGSFLERWGSTVADAFVALGVFGEVLTSARGRVIQGELTRRSNDRLVKTETNLNTSNFKLLIAEAKLEPRRLSTQDKKAVLDKIKESPVTQKVNFVIEQNDKATAFAWSIIAALKEGGIKVEPIPYKMPPGERPFAPVVLYCPMGSMSDDDPLYKALGAAGIRRGRTSVTTLSLEFETPTPLDIGKPFMSVPTDSSLPAEEYIVWVGEQSAFDDQREIGRIFEKIFGKSDGLEYSCMH